MVLTLGEKMVLLREFCGLQQKEVALRIGIPVSRLSEYENDKYEARLEILIKIAEICEMHPSYFLDNKRPEYYASLLEDLEYAYYLSELPPEARRYQKKALKHMFESSLIDKHIEDSPVRRKSTQGVVHFNKRYFAFIEKKYANLFNSKTEEEKS